MDTKRTKPDNEFTFIQEKVIPRRKNKIKKLVLATISTIFLATLFGVIARIVFMKSEGLVNKILGIDTTKRAEILFPSDPSEGMEGNGADQKLTQDHISTGADISTIQASPQATVSVTPEPTPTPEPEVAPTIVEHKITATINDYEKILLEIKKLSNAVNNSLVTITAIENKEDWADEPFESTKTSTGIILGQNNAELMVLVDYSKVKGSNEIDVSFPGGFVVGGEIWNYDRDYNLAVIAIKLKDIAPLQLSAIKYADLGESYSLTVGTPIIGLGQPNGIVNSMELGMVTSKGTSCYIMDNRLDLFTTDITNNSNSDGVIISMDGKVVGIITQVMKENSDTNICTVIGISRLKPIIEKLTNKYDRILLGVTGQDIPASILKQYELEAGIYVTKVLQDSPAFNGDIRQGDIITGINDYTVSSITNLASILNNYQPEDEIKVVVSRLSKGERVQKELMVTLSKK